MRIIMSPVIDTDPLFPISAARMQSLIDALDVRIKRLEDIQAAREKMWIKAGWVPNENYIGVHEDWKPK